jgi:hypothetical protein
VGVMRLPMTVPLRRMALAASFAAYILVDYRYGCSDYRTGRSDRYRRCGMRATSRNHEHNDRQNQQQGGYEFAQQEFNCLSRVCRAIYSSLSTRSFLDGDIGGSGAYFGTSYYFSSLCRGQAG